MEPGFGQPDLVGFDCVLLSCFNSDQWLEDGVESVCGMLEVCGQ